MCGDTHTFPSSVYREGLEATITPPTGAHRAPRFWLLYIIFSSMKETMAEWIVNSRTEAQSMQDEPGTSCGIRK